MNGAARSFARPAPGLRERWRALLVPGALAASLLVAACSTLTPQAPAGLPGPLGTPVAVAGKPQGTFSYELATPEQRMAAFDRAWLIVNDRFYDPSFNGVDWMRMRSRYLPEVEHVDSDDAFYRLLGKMVGELKDSHTSVYNAHDYRNRRESVISTFGLRVATVGGRIAIVQVFTDTDASRAGLRKGMVIRSINGEDALGRLAKLMADVPSDASPERRQRIIYTRLIAGKQQKLTLEVETGGGDGGDGGPVRADGPAPGNATPPAAIRTRIVELSRTERELPLSVVHQTLAGNIGYIAFNKFRPEASKRFEEALSRLRQTDGLVIDLRGNPGGSLDAMRSITKNFFPESRVVMTRKLRHAGGLTESDGFPAMPSPQAEMRISATAFAYTQPIAILVDNYSASSSELMATILREQRGAAIVGRPTCGCVVAVRPNGYKLPGGGAVYVAESGFLSPYGTRMEGEPMRPDREVALTLRDLDQGIDRDLVVAREWLQNRSSKVAEEHAQ